VSEKKKNKKSKMISFFLYKNPKRKTRKNLMMVLDLLKICLKVSEDTKKSNLVSKENLLVNNIERIYFLNYFP